MKKLVFILLLVINILHVFSQNRSKYLFGNDKEVELSVFIAPEFKYSSLYEIGVLYGGVKGAILFNNRFAAGLSGGAFLTEAVTEAPGSEGDITGLNQVMGYGGLYFDYITSFNLPVQISFPTVVGGGGIIFLEKKEPNSAGITDERMVEGGVFFSLEPAINIELNVIKTIRIGFGFGYRFIFKSELERFTDKDLSAPSVNFNVKFGIF